MTVPIIPGGGDNNLLSGFIDIAGYIDDLTEWTVVASNFWTTGDNRNKKLVELMVDITVYHLLARIKPRNISEIRLNRYEQAVEYLARVAKGSVNIDLNTHYDKKRGATYRFDSNEKRNYNY